MKIAIICNYTLKPNRIGGMDRFYKLFDKKCKQKEFDIDWYFSDYQYFDFYKELNIISAEGNSVEQKFIDFSNENTKKYDVIITHFTQLCTKYYKWFKEINPDAYIIAVDHNPRPLHGFTSNKKIKNKIKSILYSRYINKFIAVSEYSKEHLLKDFSSLIKKKIQVILNGISTDRFNYKDDYIGNNKFIIASHLRKEKGIQDVIFAINSLPSHLKDKIEVVIFGEGIYEIELKNLVKKLGLVKQIFFYGSVNNLSELYANYDYLIHASYGETYCYTVVESLIAKLPVITTKKAGNILNLVKNGENGFLFDIGNRGKLTNILEQILLSKTGVSKESFASVIIPNLSLDKMVDEHIKLIKCT